MYCVFSPSTVKVMARTISRDVTIFSQNLTILKRFLKEENKNNNLSFRIENCWRLYGSNNCMAEPGNRPQCFSSRFPHFQVPLYHTRKSHTHTLTPTHTHTHTHKSHTHIYTIFRYIYIEAGKNSELLTRSQKYSHADVRTLCFYFVFSLFRVLLLLSI
jgi:hypothetical protein